MEVSKHPKMYQLASNVLLLTWKKLYKNKYQKLLDWQKLHAASYF